ncbi:MAG: hypothetical protein WCD79_05930 [Chthoniobacteraceae bacterium]
MNDWPPRLKLFLILSAIQSLVTRSAETTLEGIDSAETAQQVNFIIDCVFYKKSGPLPQHWELLFAPTGALQEISIVNGWSEIYLKLAAEYDALAYLIKEHVDQ